MYVYTWLSDNPEVIYNTSSFPFDFKTTIKTLEYDHEQRAALRASRDVAMDREPPLGHADGDLDMSMSREIPLGHATIISIWS